jgi:hypothetical protein
LVIFEIGSHFMPWRAWTSTVLFVLLCVLGVTTRPSLIEMGS